MRGTETLGYGDLQLSVAQSSLSTPRTMEPTARMAKIDTRRLPLLIEGSLESSFGSRHTGADSDTARVFKLPASEAAPASLSCSAAAARAQCALRPQQSGEESLSAARSAAAAAAGVPTATKQSTNQARSPGVHKPGRGGSCT